MSLHPFLCDLATGPTYLVVAQHASDCFELIDDADDVASYGAVRSMLTVQILSEQQIRDFDFRDEYGDPWTVNRLYETAAEPEVLWSSEWDSDPEHLSPARSR